MAGSRASDLLKYRNPLEELDSSTFPQFVQQVLSKRYPSIVVFGPNKDGGIDLVADDPSEGRVVFQCKFLTGRDSKPTKSWQQERQTLGDNLRLDEEGKLLGESQYLPWQDTSKPIARYVLCHNHHSRHLKGRGESTGVDLQLSRDIERFFTSVLAQRPGFAHLSDLKAEVLSGDDLLELAKGQERLLFQLFGSALPDGIEEIADTEDAPALKRFDHYLSGHHLPYFRRADYKAKAPSARFSDEIDLLDRLFELPDDEPIFLITGPGGYGKTRLTLELCKLARERLGALAYRILEYAPAKALEELCRITPAVPIIILVDYLETQSAYEQIVDIAARLNRARLANLRIVANCRASYYKSEIAYEQVEVLDLSDISSADAEFLYRKEVFFHIMGRAGLGRPEEFGAGCGYNPVLAAFVLYLVEGSADKSELVPELRGLVEDVTYRRDLSAWLIRRLLRSANAMIGAMTVGALVRTVAPVMAVLPLRQQEMLLLRQRADMGQILNVLTHDRLVEDRTDAGIPGRPDLVRRRWVATHDVVADYFLTRFFESAADVETSIEATFALAVEVRSVRNVLVSLQRVAEIEALATFGWRGFFARQMRGSSGPAWSAARGEVLRSLLMDPSEKIALLKEEEATWCDIRDDPLFDRIIIKLTDTYDQWKKGYDGAPRFEDSTTLIPYLEPVIERDASFSAITRALRYNPAYFRDRSLAVINSAPLTIDLHFMFVAWLDAGLEFEAIEKRVLSWLGSFVTSDKAQFVLFAAMDAANRAPRGSDTPSRVLASLKPHLDAWCMDEERASLLAARFVYGAWLRAAARGGKEEARKAIAVLFERLVLWTEKHSDHPDSQYLMGYWLQCANTAGIEHTEQAIAALREAIIAWLTVPGHAVAVEASHICSAWLMASRRRRDLAEDALKTLRPFLLEWLKGKGPSTRHAAYLFHDWLVAANTAGATVNLDVVDMLQPYLVEWLQPSWRASSAEAEFVYTGWSAVVGKLPDERRTEAADTLEPFFQIWAKTKSTGPHGHLIVNSWQKAKAGPDGIGLQRQVDSLWFIVQRLRAAADDSDLLREEQELRAIIARFTVPLGLGRSARGKHLYWLTRTFDELVNYPSLLPALASFLPVIGSHPDLLSGPLPRSGTLRLTQIRLLEEALKRQPVEDYEPLARMIRYLANLRINEAQRDQVESDVARLRSAYPQLPWEAFDTPAVPDSEAPQPAGS
jgi:hypothetical protein